MADNPSETDAPARTPLNALHRELGARMVPFAGYDMPVQYAEGILAEHRHCREKAALFDVSHMGQAWLVADGEDAAAALERLVPADIQALAPGRQRYTQLTNDRGGILDDLMVMRPVEALGADRLHLVVNAACKERDLTHIAEKLDGAARLERLDDRALIAVQGPQAAAAVAAVFDDEALERVPFMGQALGTFDGAQCWLSRSGYTGEDGYEISVPNDTAEALARALLDREAVAPAGLGARDSLRLEAGLCLYGHDIDESTTPVEAGLSWSIGKRRRTEGGFPGAETILRQLAEGPARKRVGLQPEGRAPAREGTAVHDPADESEIGVVTSGGFGPTVGGPVAMGYVGTGHSAPDTEVALMVRGKQRPARVAKLPFVPLNFYRG